MALFFVFTAEISSELTITKLQSNVSSLEDLKKLKVGTLEETGYASMLRINDVKYIPIKSIPAGFTALTNKRIDVFVYDAGTLEYIIGKE